MAIDGQRTMSKTQHYRKITKPLLERKRRARMNHYLDELKELIVETMETQGEHVTKLEKADILELTVTYLKNKKGHKSTAEPLDTEKFREGYTQAAYEVSRVFASVPGIDVQFGTTVMKHLGHQIKDLRKFSSPHEHSDKTIRDCITPPRSPNDDRRIQDHQHQDEKIGDVWRPW